MPTDGLVTTQSKDGQASTLARLAASLNANGLTVFAHIDHAMGASQAGLELRPTELVIFGSPKSGTPLMQLDQSMGIDLPLKMLVATDADGKTWVAYDDPAWLAKRHELGDAAQPVIGKMAALLAAIAREASGG